MPDKKHVGFCYAQWIIMRAEGVIRRQVYKHAIIIEIFTPCHMPINELFKGVGEFLSLIRVTDEGKLSCLEALRNSEI